MQCLFAGSELGLLLVLFFTCQIRCQTQKYRLIDRKCHSDAYLNAEKLS